MLKLTAPILGVSSTLCHPVLGKYVAAKIAHNRDYGECRAITSLFETDASIFFPFRIRASSISALLAHNATIDSSVVDLFKSTLLAPCLPICLLLSGDTTHHSSIVHQKQGTGQGSDGRKPHWDASRSQSGMLERQVDSPSLPLFLPKLQVEATVWKKIRQRLPYCQETASPSCCL